jgi:hypothetical protein
VCRQEAVMQYIMNRVVAPAQILKATLRCLPQSK